MQAFCPFQRPWLELLQTLCSPWELGILSPLWPEGYRHHQRTYFELSERKWRPQLLSRRSSHCAALSGAAVSSPPLGFAGCLWCCSTHTWLQMAFAPHWNLKGEKSEKRCISTCLFMMRSKQLLGRRQQFPKAHIRWIRREGYWNIVIRGNLFKNECLLYTECCPMR